MEGVKLSRDKVLVLGGGIAGLTTALDLAESGLNVLLLEKQEKLGGHGGDYSCKEVEGFCQKCGACFIEQRVDDVTKNELIDIYCGYQLIDIKKENQILKAKFSSAKGELELEVGSAVLATGFTPYDATKKSAYGYSEYPEVMTANDLEKKLREHGNLQKAYGKELNKLAFVQCVGSRTDVEKENYCCKVGCMYAVRLAKLIRSQLPEVQIDIYYMDLQNFGKGFVDYKDACQTKDNINFILGRPAKMYYHPKKGLIMQHESPLMGVTEEIIYDAVFLSVGSQPGQDTEELARKLGIETNEDGFFLEKDDFSGGLTALEGVFVSGSCVGPGDISATILHAKSVAHSVKIYLKNSGQSQQAV